MNAIQSKLMSIQTQIKAPKNMYNSFGKYNYRNFESICEAAKPYLTQFNCSLTVSDDIIAVGSRIYVKATVTITDCESGESISVSAMARESETKKGMDESQITGATSSYARKYAVNGLFLLDDTKDADSDEFHNESSNRFAKQQYQAQSVQQQSIQPPPSAHNLTTGAQQVRNEEINKAIELAKQNVASGLLSGDFLKKANENIANRDYIGLTKLNKYCDELRARSSGEMFA